ELAGAPALPTQTERHRVDLLPIAELLARKYAIVVPSEALHTEALVISLGHPRAVEGEPRLLSSVIDENVSPMNRLTRRNIHNILVLAERLASLTRLFHIRRRAHRHLSVDAIVL